MRSDAHAEVPLDLAGARLDTAVAVLFDVPTAAARRLVAGGRVRVNGRSAKKGLRLRAADVVDVVGGGGWFVPAEPPWLAGALVHVDAALVVVDKPAGLACYPLVPGEGGTLVDALLPRFPELAEASERPAEAGLLHRLDTDTSGLCALARSRTAWQQWHAAFLGHDVDKRYRAVVEGRVDAPFSVETPLAHDPGDRRRMVAAPGAPLSATTSVRPIAATDDVSLVEVRALQGRRHQVRVHLAHAGHPLRGDVLYGGRPRADGGHLLRAAVLELPGREPIHAPADARFSAETFAFSGERPAPA